MVSDGSSSERPQLTPPTQLLSYRLPAETFAFGSGRRGSRRFQGTAEKKKTRLMLALPLHP